MHNTAGDGQAMSADRPVETLLPLIKITDRVEGMQITRLPSRKPDQVAGSLERAKRIVHQNTVAGYALHGSIQQDKRERQVREMQVVLRRHLRAEQDHSHTVRELDILDLPRQILVFVQVADLHLVIRLFAPCGNPLGNLGEKESVPDYGAVLTAAGIFGIDPRNLPEVCDSDSNFGETDFDGLLPHPVPIHAVLGDSHGALFGQGCLRPGMIKSTYGTGSSIMMNIGEQPVLSTHGVVTSLAWSMGGKVNYVLEGNLNYTGAVITWLKDDLKLIESPGETQSLAEQAERDDQLYLVPAFTGLSAPYWDSYATGMITGMTGTTGKAELVRAGLECIAYQITDIVRAMSEDAGVTVNELRVDGGPTRNTYLMQFQSDIAGTDVQVPDSEELSGIGAAYAAGLALGVWGEEIFEKLRRTKYTPAMEESLRKKKYVGWKAAVQKVLYHEAP